MLVLFFLTLPLLSDCRHWAAIGGIFALCPTERWIWIKYLADAFVQSDLWNIRKTFLNNKSKNVYFWKTSQTPVSKHLCLWNWLCRSELVKGPWNVMSQWQFLAVSHSDVFFFYSGVVKLLLKITILFSHTHKQTGNAKQKRCVDSWWLTLCVFLYFFSLAQNRQ